MAPGESGLFLILFYFLSGSVLLFFCSSLLFSFSRSLRHWLFRSASFFVRLSFSRSGRLLVYFSSFYLLSRFLVLLSCSSFLLHSFCWSLGFLVACFGFSPPLLLDLFALLYFMFCFPTRFASTFFLLRPFRFYLLFYSSCRLFPSRSLTLPQRFCTANAYRWG